MVIEEKFVVAKFQNLNDIEIVSVELDTKQAAFDFIEKQATTGKYLILPVYRKIAYE